MWSGGEPPKDGARGCSVPPGSRTENPRVLSRSKQREVLANGTPDPPSYAGGLWRRDRAQGQWAVPDSGILVPEVVVGGLSVVVVAAVVVVVAAVVVATVVGATLGMVGTVVASVVAAGAGASVLLTAPVAPTVVGGDVGGAGREM